LATSVKDIDIFKIIPNPGGYMYKIKEVFMRQEVIYDFPGDQ
jgi:hypothetical protein